MSDPGSRSASGCEGTPVVPPETPQARNLVIWPQLTEVVAHRTIGHVRTRRRRAEEAGSR